MKIVEMILTEANYINGCTIVYQNIAYYDI